MDLNPTRLVSIYAKGKFGHREQLRTLGSCCHQPGVFWKQERGLRQRLPLHLQTQTALCYRNRCCGPLSGVGSRTYIQLVQTDHRVFPKLKKERPRRGGGPKGCAGPFERKAKGVGSVSAMVIVSGSYLYIRPRVFIL